jgi:hypothetical protein
MNLVRARGTRGSVHPRPSPVRYGGPMRRLLLSVVPVLLLAAACGDDGGLAGTGGNFCDMVGSINDAGDANEEIDFFDPSAVEEAFKEFAAQIEAAKRAAPGEIKADVELLADGMQDFLEILDEADYDFTALIALEGDPRMEAVDSPQYEAAQDRVDAYCGISDTSVDDGFTDPDPDSDADLPGIDPEELEDFDFSGDEREIAIQVYEMFGHDRETAECLVDELGDFTGAEDFDLSTEFCGMTLLEITSGG